MEERPRLAEAEAAAAAAAQQWAEEMPGERLQRAAESQQLAEVAV